MKIVICCVILIFAMIAGILAANEKVNSAADASAFAKEVQQELQSLYLKVMNGAKSGQSASQFAKKKYMTALEVYNRKLNSVYLKGGGDTEFSHASWKDLNVAFKKVGSLTTLDSVSSNRVLLDEFKNWLVKAQSLSIASEKFAFRESLQTSPMIAGRINGNLNLVVEDYSLGLDTPQDRIDFVEKLTKLRAAENRIFSRGFYTTPGGYPRNYPAAYVYSNGSFGNLTTLGRRDRLTPLYNVQRQPLRRTSTPRVQITIKK